MWNGIYYNFDLLETCPETVTKDFQCHRIWTVLVLSNLP